MGRLLKHVIKEIDDNTTIYIGSKTNFFFIGTKAEWEKDKDDVEQWCHNFVDRAYFNAHEVWEHNAFNGMPKKSLFDDASEWEEACKMAVTQLWNSQRNMLDCTKEYNNYKTLENRAVIDDYIGISEEGKRVIIVKGIEEGRYWFKNEYDRDHKKAGVA